MSCRLFVHTLAFFSWQLGPSLFVPYPQVHWGIGNPLCHLTSDHAFLWQHQYTHEREKERTSNAAFGKNGREFNLILVRNRFSCHKHLPWQRVEDDINCLCLCSACFRNKSLGLCCLCHICVRYVSKMNHSALGRYSPSRLVIYSENIPHRWDIST